MVIDDIFEKQRKDSLPPVSGTHVSLRYLAHPSERITALVLDFIFVFPLMSLIFAPFYREAVSSVLYQQAELASTSIVLGVFTVLLVIWLYFTLGTYFWQTTLGCKLLSLKIEDIERRKISFITAGARGFYLLINLFTLGFFSISLFEDIKVRTFHDRLTDTVVTSKFSNRGYVRRDQQVAFVMRLASLFMVLMVGFSPLKAFLTHFYEGKERSGQNFRGCVPMETLAARGNSSLERMENALALYAAGLLNSKCLGKEADFSLWQKGENAEAYLAKAFSTASQSKKSDTYLHKVCELHPAGYACQLAQVMIRWNGKGPDSDQFEFLMRDGPKYSLVWGVRRMLSSARYDETLNYLRRLDNEIYLGPFVVQSRLEALQGLNRSEEARVLFQAAYQSSDEKAQVRLASQVCSQFNGAESCAGLESPSCQSLLSGIEVDQSLLESKNSSVAWARSLSCGSANRELWSLRKMTLSNSDQQRWLTYISFRENGQIAEAEKTLLSLLEEGLSEERPLSFEGARELIFRFPSPENLAFVEKHWEKSSHKQKWYALARDLAWVFFEIGHEAKSFVLAHTVQSLNQEQHWTYVFTAAENAIYHRPSLARLDLIKGQRWLNAFKRMPEVERPERTLASAEEWTSSKLFRLVEKINEQSSRQRRP